TVRQSIERLKKLTEMENDPKIIEALKKKEMLSLTREKEKLERALGGIKGIKKLPDAIFVIDPKQEEIAVLEARKMGIPVVAVIDTDCDPAMVDYKVPGNDDAIRAIRLFCATIADAVAEGKAISESAAEAEGKEAVSGSAIKSSEADPAQAPLAQGS
ncbi:MAG: 30S ribosomal protein S2, partial [Candidatus Binatia bacterium]